MEFKGTAGKWKIKGKKGLTITIQNGIELNPICKIDDDKLNCEHKYNALLISKAPEMLEMLNYISNETDQICNDSCMGYIVDHDDMDKLRKLIKEATEL